LEKRLAIIGIIVSERLENAAKVNEILSSYGDLIIGRMGLPYKEKNVSVISVIVDATNDEIGAISGKLGGLNGVKAKVLIAS